MQKRSHALLASALMRCENGFPARRYELAFLFGSIQPDCNPFSYLKGSLHGKKFGGHTYGNSRRYIDRHIRRFYARPCRNLWDYYTLGKLTHYVADAFTYPHNPTFPEWGWAHHRYEKALRLALQDYLNENTPRRRERRGNLPETLADLHEDYLSEESSVERDIQYILNAAELLMADCIQEAPATVPAQTAAREFAVS